MPTELLRRIVTEIPRETWESGAEKVAREIERIEAEWEVLQAARAVEEHIRSSFDVEVQAPNPMIGHNNPPLEQTLPVSRSEMDQLLLAVQSIQAQIQSGSPNPEAMAGALETAERVHRNIGVWLADKLDIAASEFFKEFGKGLGKWSSRIVAAGMGGTVLWFFGLLEKLGPLVHYLRTLAGMIGA